MKSNNSLITWLKVGCAWRWRRLRREWYLFRNFRNGPSLIRSLRDDSPCSVAICRDGVRICHPEGRTGFVKTILEVWHHCAYTADNFYMPADDDVVIDAGANVGLFSVWVARRNRNCRVLALEPFAENFAYLQMNLEAAGAEAVTPYQLALGGTVSHGVMQNVGTRSLDHQLALADHSDGGQETVPVTTLAGLIELASVDRISFLKLDIEGSEYDVFEHVSSDTLARIDRMAIEYHDNLRRGAQEMVASRLNATHEFEVRPDPCGAFGMIFARVRNKRPEGEAHANGNVETRKEVSLQQ
jgi:FkbM family methyltransferase